MIVSQKRSSYALHFIVLKIHKEQSFCKWDVKTLTILKLKSSVRFTNCYKKAINFSLY